MWAQAADFKFVIRKKFWEVIHFSGYLNFIGDFSYKVVSG